MALENEKSKCLAVEKKQKKFDQSLAEEKAVSERWVGWVSVVD